MGSTQWPNKTQIPRPINQPGGWDRYRSRYLMHFTMWHARYSVELEIHAIYWNQSKLWKQLSWYDMIWDRCITFWTIFARLRMNDAVYGIIRLQFRTKHTEQKLHAMIQARFFATHTKGPMQLCKLQTSATATLASHLVLQYFLHFWHKDVYSDVNHIRTYSKCMYRPFLQAETICGTKSMKLKLSSYIHSRGGGTRLYILMENIIPNYVCMALSDNINHLASGIHENTAGIHFWCFGMKTVEPNAHTWIYLCQRINIFNGSGLHWMRIV